MNNSLADPAGLRIAFGLILMELLVDIVGLPISSLNFLALYRTSVIHRNLKFILLCQSAAYTMRFLVKLCISEPIRLLGPNIVWHESANPVSLVLFFSNISFRSMLGHVIVLERTMATLWARNYERREARLFSCCWFSAVLIVVLFNVISQQLIIPDNDIRVTFVTMCSSYAALLLSFVEIGLFACLWLHNKQKFRHANEADFAQNYTLTERYQQLENIRTGLQLVPTLCCHFLFVLDLAIGQTFVAFQMIPDKFYEAMAVQAVNVADAIFSLFAELTMIIFHPFLRRDIRFLLCRLLLRPNRVHIATMAISSTDVNMQMMSMDGHFRMLRGSWEAEFPKAVRQYVVAASTSTSADTVKV